MLIVAILRKEERSQQVELGSSYCQLYQHLGCALGSARKFEGLLTALLRCSTLSPALISPWDFGKILGRSLRPLCWFPPITLAPSQPIAMGSFTSSRMTGFVCKASERPCTQERSGNVGNLLRLKELMLPSLPENCSLRVNGALLGCWSGNVVPGLVLRPACNNGGCFLFSTSLTSFPDFLVVLMLPSRKRSFAGGFDLTRLASAGVWFLLSGWYVALSLRRTFCGRGGKSSGKPCSVDKPH